jgi:hypothetical protein
VIQARVWSALTDEELEASLRRGTAEQSAYLASWLEALAEFDRRELWLQAGFRSCAAWLMSRCGSSSRTARDHVSVAARLGEAPLVRAALAEGRLSFSKVRAVCRVVRPENEEFLVGLAMDMTAAQLERHVRTYEASHRPITDEDEVRRRAKCGVWTWTDPDGLVHHEVVSPPEEALVIDRAIDYGIDQLHRERREADKAAKAEGREPDVRPTLGAKERRFEGLHWVCKRGLLNAERDPSDLPLDDPFLIVFHVREGEAAVDERGNVHLGGGVAVSPRVLKRLCCSSMIQAMLVGDDGRRPLDLGRRARLAQPKQKVALAATYPTCAFTGCEVSVRFCQFHHVRWWDRDRGSTDLENLRPLCRRHHSLVHEGGWELVVDGRDELVAISPRGRRYDGSQVLTDEAVSAESMVAQLEAMGFDFDDPDRLDQIAGRWKGERISKWAMEELGWAHAMVEAGRGTWVVGSFRATEGPPLRT